MVIVRSPSNLALPVFSFSIQSACLGNTKVMIFVETGYVDDVKVIQEVFFPQNFFNIAFENDVLFSQ